MSDGGGQDMPPPGMEGGPDPGSMPAQAQGGDPMQVLMSFVPPEAIPQVVEAALALLMEATRPGGGMHEMMEGNA